MCFNTKYHNTDISHIKQQDFIFRKIQDLAIGTQLFLFRNVSRHDLSIDCGEEHRRSQDSIVLKNEIKKELFYTEL